MFLALFCQTAQVVNFHQASINVVHQRRLTFDLEIETTRDRSSSFRTRSQGHISRGDSAEEFMVIHALGCERLLVLSGGLPSNPLKNYFLLVWRLSNAFGCFPHTSPQMYF